MKKIIIIEDIRPKSFSCFTFNAFNHFGPNSRAPVKDSVPYQDVRISFTTRRIYQTNSRAVEDNLAMSRGCRVASSGTSIIRGWRAVASPTDGCVKKRGSLGSLDIDNVERLSLM